MSNAIPTPGAGTNSSSTSSRSGTTKPPSMDELEAQIAASRQSLAATIDELTRKAAPKALVKRQVEEIRTTFYEATHTPQGDVRVERVAALATAGVLLVALGLWRRTRRV